MRKWLWQQLNLVQCSTGDFIKYSLNLDWLFHCEASPSQLQSDFLTACLCLSMHKRRDQFLWHTIEFIPFLSESCVEGRRNCEGWKRNFFLFIVQSQPTTSFCSTIENYPWGTRLGRDVMRWKFPCSLLIFPALFFFSMCWNWNDSLNRKKLAFEWCWWDLNFHVIYPDEISLRVFQSASGTKENWNILQREWKKWAIEGIWWNCQWQERSEQILNLIFFCPVSILPILQLTTISYLMYCCSWTLVDMIAGAVVPADCGDVGGLGAAATTSGMDFIFIVTVRLHLSACCMICEHRTAARAASSMFLR